MKVFIKIAIGFLWIGCAYAPRDNDSKKNEDHIQSPENEKKQDADTLQPYSDIKVEDGTLVVNNHEFPVNVFAFFESCGNDDKIACLLNKYNTVIAGEENEFNRYYDGAYDTIKYNKVTTLVTQQDTFKIIRLFRNGKWQYDLKKAVINSADFILKNEARVGMLYSDFIKNLPELKSNTPVYDCIYFGNAADSEDLTFYFSGAPARLTKISYLSIYD